MWLLSPLRVIPNSCSGNRRGRAHAVGECASGGLQHKGGDGKRGQFIGKRPVLQRDCREFHRWVGKQHQFIFPPQYPEVMTHLP